MVEALGISIDDLLKKNFVKGKDKPYKKMRCVVIFHTEKNEVIKYRNSLDRLAYLCEQIIHKGIGVSKKDYRPLIDDAFKFASGYSNKIIQ